MSDNHWSEWLDFSPETVSKIPELPGVFMMHTAMKILFIGSSENMKKSVEDRSSDKCVSKSTRFRYRKEDNFKNFENVLIKEFKKRHEGQLPACMN